MQPVITHPRHPPLSKAGNFGRCEMRLLKMFAAYLWRLPNLHLLKCVWWLQHYRSVQYGAVVFCGDDKFLALVNDALEQIRSTDAQLLSDLKKQRLTFWYHPTAKNSDILANVFPINDAFCVWGPPGVAARIIEGYFTNQIIGGRLRNILRVEMAAYAFEENMKRTRDWLILHEYPQSLVDAYKAAVHRVMVNNDHAGERPRPPQSRND